MTLPRLDQVKTLAHYNLQMSRQRSSQQYLKAIERRRSVISGWGVYAGERITKNSRIVDYAGEKISKRESSVREARQVPRGRIWCFTINSRFVRDASVGGNIARFINHSCRPNCYVHIVGDTIWIRAARTIAPDEELTYNYNTGGDAGIPCRCRPGCKGMI
ncbi:MAG: SET domain-containing protein-lysine N-methyltransferase [Vicinamibacterales bacterium]